MGILGSIKKKIGGGSGESPSPGNKMRTPPGRDSPPPEGPEPGPGPGPDRSRGPEPRRGERDPPPGPGNDRPGAGRGGRGSTVDFDRELRGNPGSPGSGGPDEFDFEPPGGAEERPAPHEEGRRPGSGGMDNPQGRGNTGMEPPRRGESGGLPEPPGGPDMSGGGDERRLSRIEEQNEHIIDLLEDIRDSVGGRRR